MRKTFSKKWMLLLLALTILSAAGYQATTAYSFPVELKTPDNKFQPFPIRWEFRDDMVSEIRKHGGGSIRIVIHENFIFHVFDNRGQVFIMSAGDTGSTPSVAVQETDTYSGDPHAHHLKKFPGGA